jgi:hypothetical protein
MKQLLIALVLAQAGGLVLAQPAAATAPAAAGAQAAAFRCGGVGQDEQDRMKAEAAQHDLMLTFAVDNGAYLADVAVEIRRGGQTVLQGRCSGPLMLADLAPAGSYEVRAVAQGREQRKTVAIGGAKPARLSFTWPAR